MLREGESSVLIHEALIAEGFELDRSETAFQKYVGAFQICGSAAACEIHIRDTNFLSLPKLKILDDRFAAHSVAHFEDSGFYCYANSSEIIIDKYNPAGAVRSCLDMMKAALDHHLKNDLSNEVAREFLQHWFAEAVFYTEFDGSGDRTVKLVQVENDGGRHVLATENEASHSLIGSIPHPTQKKANLTASLVQHAGVLTFHNGQRQPETLDDLVAWADTLTPRLGARVMNTFRYEGDQCVDTAFIAAENSTVGVQLEFADVPSNLLQRKAGFSKMLAAMQNKVKIKRIITQEISKERLFQRNLKGDQKNLRAKTIALVGCGTIGGHLSKLLAQSGAGIDGGRLVLIDDELLEIANVGRHFLGPNRVGQNKAKGCEQELLRLFPQSDVTSAQVDVLEVLPQLIDYDLIIDATGEEALSVLINEWLKGLHREGNHIAGLFIRLFGNADAAQALLVDNGEFSCFRCLKPRHGEDWRYEPRRNPNILEITPANCGQAPFLPYGVGGSVIAAGVASNMALDWASDSISPRLRTVRINFETTQNVKDVNPKISPSCPLCGAIRET